MKITMATATASFSRVIAILLYALFFTGMHTEVTADVPSILPVCKTVGGGSMFFDVQFCLEALGSDGRSANAGMNYRTYSVIASDLLTANATSTAAKINTLIRVGGGRDDQDARAHCLRSCQALYGGMVQTQPSCAAAVRDVRDGEATGCLGKAASAAKECEVGFGKSKVASPVTMENDDAFKLAKVAVVLLSNAY